MLTTLWFNISFNGAVKYCRSISWLCADMTYIFACIVHNTLLPHILAEPL